MGKLRTEIARKGEKMDNLTIEQQAALRRFWLHMCIRISKDANIQYYCGAMTETIRLAVEAYSKLHPEKDAEEFERVMLSSNVSDDCDVVRLQKLIWELENAAH
jgi:hypothetical protein